MMPNIRANGIQIEYETHGNPSSRPLILIMGLGGQLIHWHEEFCAQLAAKGLFVIRFDNRDVGLSTKFEEAGLPDIRAVFNALLRGEEIQAPYSLNDMADDIAGLLDALNYDSAHICGASMGGMIAQIFAIRHPRRVLSLISIYSTTGNPQLPPPNSEAIQALVTPPPVQRQAYIDYAVKTHRTIAGRGFPFDEDYHRRIAARAYDRAFYPQGVARQLSAILAQQNRKPALAGVTAPALVIHGTDDLLVPVECGRDTAAAIPGAQLVLIDGMGHDLPQKGGPWPQVIAAIASHTKKAEG
jgi:pimeloyl-ACP methyl ester carboxylesterase